MKVDSSTNFFLTLQDILNPDLSFIFGQNASNKIVFQISAFLLLLRQDYNCHNNHGCIHPCNNTPRHATRCVLITC